MLYFHGHVHDGSNFCKINKIPIINPGPLTYGQIGLVVIEEKNKKWEVKSTSFIKLDNYGMD